MKSLPDIGTKPTVTVMGIKSVVKIVAHHQGYAVYVWYSNGDWHSRVGAAEDFEIVANEPEQDTCPPGQHNYVQIHEAHQNKAFCTRCGKKIPLE